MAKVTGGLFSLTASGQLAKTLVYSRWKGVKTVRSYVIPSNPQSADQTTQRGYLTLGVTRWRDVDLTGADKVAFDRAAAVDPVPMSGFNKLVQTVIAANLADKAHLNLTGGDDVSTTGEQIEAEINTTSALAVSLRWGLTPSALVNVEAMVEDGTSGKYEKTIAALTSGRKYYFQFYITTTENLGSTSGIYEFVCE